MSNNLRARTLVRSGWIRLPGCLLGSWVMMWLVPGMVLGTASASLCFTWMLSLSTWELMWMD
jgi:hypothetical protein